ncbi:hypothetical protein N7461_004525 [Penicillium sp. DV-2018c]|nr:hypothetical protein N7461_004525 [Penicillium sp. DV-2018c]
MRPAVGIGVFVFNTKGQFIIGKRKGSHGAGTWGLPGGHLELNESFETCAIRETLEETGLQISDVRCLTVTNSIMKAEKKHYVTVFMGGVCVEGGDGELRDTLLMSTGQTLEPEKCECWEWISWGEMRTYGEEEMRAGECDTDGFQGRRLFMPLLDLFRQWPEFRV